MKVLQIVLFLFVLISNARSAQEVEGLLFGNEEGFVKVNLNLAPEKNQAAKAQVLDYIQKNRTTHPFLWSMPNVEFFWVVGGDLNKIHQTIAQKKTAPSWIWAGIDPKTPLELKVSLLSDGRGTVGVYQGENLVGRCFCRSSGRSKQPSAGNTNLSGKQTESVEGEKGRVSRKHDSWMPWAIGIGPATGGYYLHGGDTSTQSDGCIRIGRGTAQILYRILKGKEKVEIVHLKE